MCKRKIGNMRRTYNNILKEYSEHTVELLMKMYKFSNTFEYLVHKRTRLTQKTSVIDYSKYHNIYEFKIESIFKNYNKDKNNNITDPATSQTYILLNRMYKILTAGLYIIDTDIRSMNDSSKPIGYREISITNMVALHCLHRISILKDIANPSNYNGYTFQDDIFKCAYNKTINEINNKAQKELRYTINELVKYHSKLGMWKPKRPQNYSIINLYNIMKHGLESSDFFEISDRDVIREHLDKEDINITDNIKYAEYYNKQLRIILRVCKTAIENNLMRRNEEANFFKVKNLIE